MANDNEPGYPVRPLSPANMEALLKLVDSVNRSIEKDRNRLSQRILRLLFPSRNEH